MKVIEKHGARWQWSEHDGELRYEIYDERSDLIGAVHEKPPGVFIACLYRKVEDPGSSDIWSQLRPVGLFEDLKPAKEHIKTLIANRAMTDR